MKTFFAAVIPTLISSCIRFTLPLLIALNAPNCFSDWTQKIQCPTDHIHRDVREYAGREEFCEIVKPGFLAFKDGPYRSWYSEGHPGDSGQYLMGRQVGHWREYDRFDRCQQHEYPAVYAREERRHGFKQEVPISYQDEKYVVDFGSCRSTWVTQTTGSNPVSLNISGDYLYRCQISYLPQSFIDHGGKGSYVCYVPFEVGTRKLASLDLLKELPLLGLPQFCREVNEKGEPLLISEDSWDLATTVDVECATITPGKAANGTLEIRLNQFASALVRKASTNSTAFNTLLCHKPIANPKISADAAGRSVLTYKLDSELPQAEKQERCVTEQFKRPMPCH